MKTFIIKFIDSFYFLVKKFLPLKTYRYAVCGGTNVVFDALLYFVFFHYVFSKQNVDLYFVVLSPHIASLFFVFPITFVSGFLLNKYIAFPYSDLPTKTQFLRYMLVGFGAIVLSYFIMKLLVDGFGFYPTPCRLVAILATILYSYILQNKFTFKVVKA